MNTQATLTDINLGEILLERASDNLYTLILYSILALYIISFKYKDLSFEYIKRIITISTVCFTIVYSYLVYVDDNKYMLSQDIRELKLKIFENTTLEHKQQIDIYIQDLEDTKEKISNSTDMIKQTAQGVTFLIIFFLLILFVKELLVKTYPTKAPRYLKAIIEKEKLHWREKRENNYYYKKGR